MSGRSHHAPTGLALAGLLVSGLAGCTSALASRPPDVLVILVDTLRADHLESHGYDRVVSPNLTAFAAESLVFERAISQDAWTLPSTATLLSGVYPQSHLCLRGQGDNTRMTLSEDLDMLAEQFRRAGYDTAALLKTPILVPERGFDQGFDSWDRILGPSSSGVSGEQLTDAVLRRLEQQAADPDPLFLYVHYMDPHSAYMAPEPYYERFAQPGPSKVTGLHTEAASWQEGEPFTEADRRRTVDLYDGEILYWDAHFGRLLAQLEASGRRDETVVVVTADHGEQFNEHGRWLHGDLWQENIHVPLMFRVPGVEPTRVQTRVQQMDVAPTLAGLGLIAQGQHWEGRDLSGAARGEAVPLGDVYSEYAHNMRTLISADGWKVLQVDRTFRLYDLTSDPGETRDLAAAHPERLAELTARLQATRGASKRLGASLTRKLLPEAPSAETEGLRALGYIE